jgi:hypothetical protein
MYSQEIRAKARELLHTGQSLNSISKQLGVSRSTLRDWRDRPSASPRRNDCVRCQAQPELPPESPYSHLLGLYLGDGCISMTRKGVFTLRIACCNDYPALIEECVASVQAVRAGPVSRVRAPGCTHVVKCWKHWPCLFPQHGPGKKHLRRIELEDWQREVVQRHPGQFVRGLFHSDGCRVLNWTERSVAGGRKRYAYSRYFFSNESADIMQLCQWALALLDVRWTMPKANTLSVARKPDVAVLDVHVGPKS